MIHSILSLNNMPAFTRPSRMNFLLKAVLSGSFLAFFKYQVNTIFTGLVNTEIFCILHSHITLSVSSRFILDAANLLPRSAWIYSLRVTNSPGSTNFMRIEHQQLQTLLFHL